MVSTPYKCQLNRICHIDQCILYASQQLAPYEYWIKELQKKVHCN